MKNHILLIMRHAKSDWSVHTASDFERKLTDRGKRDAKKMGAWLKHQDLVPEIIVSSPAARAERTALIVSREINIDPARINRDERIYDASLEDLLKVMATHMQEARRVLLIGHNPGLETLLDYLSSAAPEPNRAGKLLTTAAIAVLDYGRKPISAGKRSAQLVCLTRPRD